MSYRLRDGMSFCFVNGQVAFIDITASRYFCAPPAAGAALLAAGAEGEIARPDDGALSALISGGYLVPDSEGRTPRPCVAVRPIESALDGDRAALTWGGLVAALGHQAAAVTVIRTTPFRRVVHGLQRRKAQVKGQDGSMEPGKAAAEAQRFAASRRIVSAHMRCLTMSLALFNYLAARGCASDFVFGVRLLPFSAHCWIQQGDMALNDTVDHANLYTPILVI